MPFKPTHDEAKNEALLILRRLLPGAEEKSDFSTDNFGSGKFFFQWTCDCTGNAYDDPTTAIDPTTAANTGKIANNWSVKFTVETYEDNGGVYTTPRKVVATDKNNKTYTTNTRRGLICYKYYYDEEHSHLWVATHFWDNDNSKTVKKWTRIREGMYVFAKQIEDTEWINDAWGPLSYDWLAKYYKELLSAFSPLLKTDGESLPSTDTAANKTLISIKFNNTISDTGITSVAGGGDSFYTLSFKNDCKIESYSYHSTENGLVKIEKGIDYEWSDYVNNLYVSDSLTDADREKAYHVGTQDAVSLDGQVSFAWSVDGDDHIYHYSHRLSGENVTDNHTYTIKVEDKNIEFTKLKKSEKKTEQSNVDIYYNGGFKNTQGYAVNEGKPLYKHCGTTTLGNWKSITFDGFVSKDGAKNGTLYAWKTYGTITRKFIRKGTFANGLICYAWAWHTIGSGDDIDNRLSLCTIFELKDPDSHNYNGFINFCPGMYLYVTGGVKPTQTPTDPNNPDTQNPDGSQEEEHKIEERQGSTEWENSADYQAALDAGNARADMAFWNQLYNGYGNTYSLKSHRSIIGLPLQFMPNVDMRVGASTYGKQYMEDIIYDAAVVCIKPGGPVLNPKWTSGDLDDGTSSAPAYSDDGVTKLLASFGRWKAYWNMFKNLNSADGWKQLLYSIFTSGSARFYSFMQDYTHYTHYVNTLCHMFIAWLDIGDKEYYIGNGSKKKYMNFNEYYQEIETDEGLGLNYQYGYDTAVYAYYSPESDINQTFSNSTTESQLSATIREASDVSKEWGFLMNAAGLEKGAGLFDWSSIATSISSFTSRIPVVGRLFGNLSEGVTTILAGNNMSLPEIYSDSDTTTQHTFKIKLISPYGDPESIFWYVLRPLAKLLAFSLPRQYGPNSYTSPFIVQAFSKGQFNCQLGIVTELSVTRGGNGGESHTVHHLPTELEVSLTIADMYEKVFLSNEYFGNSNAANVIGAGLDWLFSGGDTAYGTVSKLIQTGTTMSATHLMFNNVGLIDFTASLAGGNLNQPSFMSSWTFISQLMKNRSAETVVYENGEWRFPFWEKTLRDNFNQATTNIYSAISTGG